MILYDRKTYLDFSIHPVSEKFNILWTKDFSYVVRKSYNSLARNIELVKIDMVQRFVIREIKIYEKSNKKS